jgi:hypothetical protein
MDRLKVKRRPKRISPGNSAFFRSARNNILLYMLPSRLRALPRGFWLAALAAGLLRAWVCWHNPTVPLHDPTPYYDMAVQLFKTGTLSFDGTTPTAFRLPGLSLVMTAFFTVTRAPESTNLLFALNVALTFAAMFFTWEFSRRAVSETAALAAVWLFGLNPHLAALNLSLGIESIYALLLALIAWTLVRLIEDPKPAARWAAAGAAIGVSLTVRSTFLVFPFAFAAGYALLRGDRLVSIRAALDTLTDRAELKRGILLFACAYVFVLPWVVRNYAHFGRIIPFEDGMGMHTLWQGSVSVRGIVPDTALPEPMRTYYFANDPAIGPHSKKLAFENISRAPLTYLGYCLGRLPIIWIQNGWPEILFNASDSFRAYRARGDWLRAGTKALFKFGEIFFVLGAFWGMALSVRNPKLMPLGLMLLYMNIHVFTMGLPRYNVPILPVQSLLFFVAICDLRERLLRRLS